MGNRVVITGMGVITSLGSDLDTFWNALLAGRSGIRRIAGFDPTPFSTQIGGEVPDFDPQRYLERRDARRMDRFAQFAVAAATEALADARLELSGEDPEQVGAILGSGIGGIGTFCEQHETFLSRGPDRVSPFFIPMIIANMGAGQVAIRFGARGPNTTLVTACASSAHAVGEAFRVLQRGEAQVMLTGGSEAVLVPMAYAGFCAMKAMSTRNDAPERASRPFDLHRDGFVMSEGAAVLVLETLDHAQARGARIYAELVGYGMSCDAYHMVEPDPTGRGGAASMRRALADAGLRPDEVDYVNAHGTSTPKGDVAETLAIKEVFGEAARRLAVSSTKSMTGHLLGAAGALELAICALAVQRGEVPPTINLDEPDPECDLDYVAHRFRRMEVRSALSNAFGFGGHNATLVVRRHA